MHYCNKFDKQKFKINYNKMCLNLKQIETQKPKNSKTFKTILEFNFFLCKM